MEEKQHPRQSPFRFLSDDEYSALDKAERMEYLREALKAFQAGRELDFSPKREQ